MKQTILYILIVDVIICILLDALTGAYEDALTMLFTSAIILLTGVALTCVSYCVKPFKKFAIPMLLNSMLLPFAIYIIFEITSSYRIHNLYVMYHFEKADREYQIFIHKDTNEFYINRTYEGGSEVVIHGTYISSRNNEYKLYVSDTGSYDSKNKELLIKNDSIYGFDGTSYKSYR